jgi:hypothetical protein
MMSSMIHIWMSKCNPDPGNTKKRQGKSPGGAYELSIPCRNRGMS